jgi:hypothetical protein
MIVAGIALVAAFCVILIGMEPVRSIVHARRERRDGLGGTQDIVIWGLLAALVCGLLALVCLVVGAARR